MEIFENRIFFWKYLYVTILLIIPLFVYGQKNVIITNLSTDFLINPDRVLKDGYPINIKLEEAVKEPKNYQIIGIVKKIGSGQKILIFSDKKIYYQLDNRINEL